MTPETIESSMNLLRLVRQETDAIGVAVSFGKDSLATLDLCSRLFRRIEGYYMYRVRDMEIVNGWADDVLRRFGVKVRMYPHFDLSRCYRNAVLQPHWKGLQNVPVIGFGDIESRFREEAGVNWIAYGWRRNDSFSRALIMRKCRGYDPASGRIFPIRAWSRKNVYEYLEARKIPLPPGLGRKDQGGLDFHPGAISELKEKHPEDYRRWLADFPFSELQAASETAQDCHETELAQ